LDFDERSNPIHPGALCRAVLDHLSKGVLGGHNLPLAGDGAASDEPPGELRVGRRFGVQVQMGRR